MGGGELASERVEACVDEMSSLSKNKLQLNDSKTEVMIICSVHNHSDVNIPHISRLETARSSPFQLKASTPRREVYLK